MADGGVCGASSYTDNSLLFTPAEPDVGMCEPEQSTVSAPLLAGPKPAEHEPHEPHEPRTSTARRFGDSVFGPVAVAGAALKLNPSPVVVSAPRLAPVIDIGVAAARAAAAEAVAAEAVVAATATATATEVTVAAAAVATTEVAAPAAGGALASGAAWGGLAVGGVVVAGLGLLGAAALLVSRSSVGGQSGPLAEPSPDGRREGGLGPYGGTLPPGGVPQQPALERSGDAGVAMPTPDAQEPLGAPMIGYDFVGAGTKPPLVGFDEDPNGKRPALRGFLPEAGQVPNGFLLPPNPNESDKDRATASGGQQSPDDTSGDTLSADTAEKDNTHPEPDKEPGAWRTPRVHPHSAGIAPSLSFAPAVDDDGVRLGTPKPNAWNMTEPVGGLPMPLIFSAERSNEFGPWGHARPTGTDPKSTDPKSTTGALSPDARLVGLELPLPANYSVDNKVSERHIWTLSQNGGSAVAQAYTSQPVVPAGVEKLQFIRPLPQGAYAAVYAEPPVQVDDNTVKVRVSTYAVDKEWHGPIGMDVSLVSTGEFLYRSAAPNMSIEVKKPEVPTPPGLVPGARLSGYLVPSSTDFTPDTRRTTAAGIPTTLSIWRSDAPPELGPLNFARPSSTAPKSPMLALPSDARLVGVERPGREVDNINGVVNGAHTMVVAENGGLAAAQAWAGQPMAPVGFDAFKFTRPWNTDDTAAVFAEPPVQVDADTVKVKVSTITVGAQGQEGLISQGEFLYRRASPELPLELKPPTVPTAAAGGVQPSGLAPSGAGPRSNGQISHAALLERLDLAAALEMRKYGAGPVTATVTNLRYHDTVGWPLGAPSPENVAMYASPPQITWVEGKAPNRATVTVQGYAVDPAKPHEPARLVVSGDLMFVNFDQATARPAPLVNVQRPVPSFTAPNGRAYPDLTKNPNIQVEVSPNKDSFVIGNFTAFDDAQNDVQWGGYEGEKITPYYVALVKEGSTWNMHMITQGTPPAGVTSEALVHNVMKLAKEQIGDYPAKLEVSFPAFFNVPPEVMDSPDYAAMRALDPANPRNQSQIRLGNDALRLGNDKPGLLGTNYQAIERLVTDPKHPRTPDDALRRSPFGMSVVQPYGYKLDAPLTFEQGSHVHGTLTRARSADAPPLVLPEPVRTRPSPVVLAAVERAREASAASAPVAAAAARTITAPDGSTHPDVRDIPGLTVSVSKDHVTIGNYEEWTKAYQEQQAGTYTGPPLKPYFVDIRLQDFHWVSNMLTLGGGPPGLSSDALIHNAMNLLKEARGSYPNKLSVQFPSFIQYSPKLMALPNYEALKQLNPAVPANTEKIALGEAAERLSHGRSGVVGTNYLRVEEALKAGAPSVDEAVMQTPYGRVMRSYGYAPHEITITPGSRVIGDLVKH